MLRKLKQISVVVTFSLIIGLAGIISAEESGDAKDFMIAGAGPSTKVVELLAKEFMAAHPGYTITVPPKSIKHAGGLKWATVQNMLFGRTGRPMSESDKKAFPTAIELPIAKTKVAFAISKSLGITKLTLKQWIDIYKGKIQSWKDVGGPGIPIILLGRNPGESVFSAITNTFPFFGKVRFPKVYDKEHQIIKAIGQIPGAVGFSTLSNFLPDDNYTALDIAEFEVGLRVAIVYDAKNENAETVGVMKKFLESDAWINAVKNNNFMPIFY